MSSAAWELVFLMLIMKIPIVYLCVVVWYAIKAEPRPPEGAARLAPSPDPALNGSAWRRSRRPQPFRGGPQRGPRRGAGRPARVAMARRETL
jgi:hypothetical protein